MAARRPVRVVRGGDQRGPIASSVIVLGALAVIAFTVVGGHSVKTVAPITAVVVTAAVAYKTVLSWRSLVSLILILIFFIPIRRYGLPVHLPFNLEPYRLLVAFVAAGWLTSLLIDRRVRARRTGLEGPLGLYVLAVVFSLMVNTQRVGTVSSEVYKKLAFFASFFIVLYVVVSVIRRVRDIEALVSLMVVSGGLLGIFALVESRTHYNVFDHLSNVIPFLHLDASQIPKTPPRARLRVYGSAQHAIAFGAVFAMLLPLALYRVRTRKTWFWWTIPFVILLGGFSTGARTTIVMFVVEVAVFLWLRPKETRALWPLLIPALLFVHVATPGVLGAFRTSLFPKGGLIAQQQYAGAGHGRLATLGPALSHEFKDQLVGEGFGTRVVTVGGPIPANGPILDDQWLGILLETGAIGAIALLWMFLRFIRRAGRDAKRDLSDRGWLLASITASVASFAASMFFYDAFAFVQITFMLFVFLGLGVAVMRTKSPEWADLGARRVSPTRARYASA